MRIQRRVDFCWCSSCYICFAHQIGQYPKYYTFTGPDYEENKVIRHIEPALAFQLELGRLANFDIKPIFTNNRNIHVYDAIGKNAPSDKRFSPEVLLEPVFLKKILALVNI